MEGVLNLYRNLLQGYSSKYCILLNEILTVCDKRGGDVEFRIHLGIAKIREDSDKLLLFVHNGCEEVEFKAKDLSNLMEWTTKM